MLLTYELVLLSRQPDGGPLIHDLVLDRVLAGSLLADLRLAHKITIDGDGSGTTVTVTDPSPTGGAVLDAALAGIATIAPTDLKTAVKHLDHDLSAKFRADLTADGHLHEQTHRVLGLINNTHWTAADAAQHEDLIAHVRACSTTANGHTEHDRALLALLAASGALDTLIGEHSGANIDDTALADADPITVVIRRMVRNRRFAAAAGASAGGTTGGSSS